MRSECKHEIEFETKRERELVRVPESLRPAKESESGREFKLFGVHESRLERIRVEGQTRARVDENSNYLRVHESR